MKQTHCLLRVEMRDKLAKDEAFDNVDVQQTFWVDHGLNLVPPFCIHYVRRRRRDAGGSYQEKE